MRTELRTRFDAKVSPEPMSGCWLWTGSANAQGYGVIGEGGTHGRNLKAHRAAWELYRGSIPADRFVLHRCDTPCCVNPDHLFLGTHVENMADMVSKGRQVTPSGNSHWSRTKPESILRRDQHPGAKLSEVQVAAIRLRLGRGETQTAISERYGVHKSTISLIARGKKWPECRPGA